MHISTLKKLKNKKKRKSAQSEGQFVKKSRQKLLDLRTEEVELNSKILGALAQELLGPSEVSEEDYGIIPPTEILDQEYNSPEDQDTLANDLWGPSND